MAQRLNNHRGRVSIHEIMIGLWQEVQDRAAVDGVGLAALLTGVHVSGLDRSIELQEASDCSMTHKRGP
jgi:hypothetical protein